MNILKYSGELVPYSSAKIRQSLEKSGTSHKIIDKIVRQVDAEVHEGMTTKKIFKTVHKLLRKHAKSDSHRYHLKQAIMELGPSGYPFERLIGEILRAMGFEVQVGVFMKGCHVTHEVDVVANKGNLQYIVECKFHNSQGQKSDVKVPLYIQSRFMDIESKLQPTSQGKKMNGWIVTNTRFSSDAIQYGTGVGLRMMSWDYPEHNSLRDTMTRLNLHPITSLHDLTKHEKKAFLDNDIVLCRSVLEKPEFAAKIIKDQSKRKRIISQIQRIVE